MMVLVVPGYHHSDTTLTTHVLVVCLGMNIYLKILNILILVLMMTVFYDNHSCKAVIITDQRINNVISAEC